jgi:proline iminopeptidase
VKTKFESLHVEGPDDQAADDYFGYQMNMYQGSDHPQAGYRCEGGGPEEGGSWRPGTRVADRFLQQAVDADGNFNMSLVDGVEGFTNKVLFMAGECQKVIGVKWQKRQMEYFANAELAVIPSAGHEMFAENPEASITAVREYLDAPVK